MLPPFDSETRLEITAARLVADGVRSLRLERSDRAPLPTWEAGAHIDLVLPNGLVRQYSLCGSPADTTAYEVSVLLAPDTRGGSECVHNDLQEGDTLTVGGPRNHFRFDLPASNQALFIAGGIGITPILPMIERAERDAVDWRLVYGGRTRTTMAYLDRLGQYGDRVQIVPEDEEGFIDLKGLLGEPIADTHVFTCGPTGLLDAIQDLCATWPAGTLHLERFAAGVVDENATSDSFTVIAERSGKTCQVAADESIIDAVRRGGIIVPTSCREGICGTCETKVIAGVPDHRDFLLGDADRESGTTMLICVSRANTPELVLDL